MRQSEEPEAEDEPIDPRAEYHKGNAAFREGRLTAARFHYRRSIQGEIAFDSMCNLGRTEASLHDDVAAYEHLTKCLDLHPSDSELIGSRNKFADLRREVSSRMTEEQLSLAERRLELFPLAGGTKRQGVTPYDGGGKAPRVARTVVTVTLGAMGLVGLGVGAGLFVHSEEKGREAEALRDQLGGSGGSGACADPTADDRCGQLTSLLVEADDFHNASVATMAASGGLLVGAIVGYLLWPKPKAGRSVSASESRDPSGDERPWTPVVQVSVPDSGAWFGIRGRF